VKRIVAETSIDAEGDLSSEDASEVTEVVVRRAVVRVRTAGTMRRMRVMAMGIARESTTIGALRTFLRGINADTAEGRDIRCGSATNSEISDAESDSVTVHRSTLSTRNREYREYREGHIRSPLSDRGRRLSREMNIGAAMSSLQTDSRNCSSNSALSSAVIRDLSAAVIISVRTNAKLVSIALWLSTAEKG